MTLQSFTTSGALALLTVIRRDGVIESAAPGLAEALGLERSALVGRSIFELVFEQDRPALQAAWRALRAGSAPSSFEVRLIGANSTLRWCAWQAVVDELAGVILATIRYAPEVAERARAQRRELLLSVIAANAPILAWITDKEGNHLEVVGRGPAQLEGDTRASNSQRIDEIFAAFPELLDAFVRALEGAGSFERYQVGDAALDIWLAAAGKENEERTIVGVALDVTKEAENQRECEVLRDMIVRSQKELQGRSWAILPVWKRTLCVPIMDGIGDLWTLARLMESVLVAIRARRARHIIFDLSGLNEIDSMIMNGILRIAHAIQIIGAQVILTGIKPAVAATMVYLTDGLTKLPAFQTSEDALRRIIRARGRRWR